MAIHGHYIPACDEMGIGLWLIFDGRLPGLRHHIACFS